MVAMLRRPDMYDDDPLIALVVRRQPVEEVTRDVSVVADGARGIDQALGHRLVGALDGGRHLVRHRAGHDHQVRLPRTRRERDDAEPDEVVPAHGCGDELDRAAGEAEVEHPQAVAPAPVEDEPKRRGGDPGADADPLDLNVYTHVRT